MKTKKKYNEDDVILYYDLNEAQYKLNWKLDTCLALHYGYQDEENRSFEKSLINMNAQLAKRAKITENDFVLDAGCGVGGSSIYLAKHLTEVSNFFLEKHELPQAKYKAVKTTFI